MKDLEELGRLRDLGLLNDEEFETARQEIFSRRPNATNPANDDDVDPEEPEGSVEEGEVTSPSELDIFTGNEETTTDSADNWWRASDGQWYPPEALASVKEQGWFQDDDGQWYPPSQAGTKEESSVSVEHATESSSEREIDPEPSDTQAPVEKQNREENDQKQDWPGVRPLPIAPRSPKSPDSETVNFSQPKNSDRSPGRKKLLIAMTAAVIVMVAVFALIVSSGPDYEVCRGLAEEIVENGLAAERYINESMEALVGSFDFDAEGNRVDTGYDDLRAKSEQALERAQQANDEFVALGCEGYAE